MPSSRRRPVTRETGKTCVVLSDSELFESLPKKIDMIQQGFREGKSVFCVTPRYLFSRVVSTFISKDPQGVGPFSNRAVDEPIRF